MDVRSPRRPEVRADRAAVLALVGHFLEAFTSGPEGPSRLDRLPDLFVPGALVVRTAGDEPEVLSVADFIAPRRTLLASGRLQDFREWPLDGEVRVFGDVAHWFGGYAKHWSEGGVEHHGRGMKSVQLVRTSAGWRITAVAWDDERPGLSAEADARL